MNVLDFDDYRQFLRKTIAAMPNGGHGQNKRISEAAGISTAFFSQVLSEKRQLSAEQASLIADFLGLSEAHAEYFLLLVEIDRAGNHSLRARLKQRQAKLKKAVQVIGKRFASVSEVSKKDQPIYYSDWIYNAIHQLTAIPGFQTEFKIADRLNLPLKKVKEALTFLIATGLCAEKNGRFNIGPARVHLSPESPWIKQHHLHWRSRAIEEFDTDDERSLHYSSPMTLSRGDYEKIRKLLVDTIEQVGTVVDPSPSEDLACLNIDWFHIGRRGR